MKVSGLNCVRKEKSLKKYEVLPLLYALKMNVLIF